MTEKTPQDSMFHVSEGGRWGLVVLGLLVILWGLTEVNQMRTDQVRQVELLKLRLETRRLALTGTDWQEQFQGANTVLSDIQSTFWQATTPGIASASIRGDLEGLVRDLRLRQARLELGEPQPVDTVSNLFILELRLTAEDNGGQFANVILKAEKTSGALILDLIEYSADQRQFTVHWIAPILLQPTVDDNA